MENAGVDQLLLKARSSTRKNKINDAKDIYKEILKIFPHNKRAQDGLKNINKDFLDLTAIKLKSLFNKGYFLEVANQAEKLTKTNPNYFEFWKFLGLSNINLGSFKNAEFGFRMANSLKKDDPYILFSLSASISKQGRLDEAIYFYRKALIIKPDYFEAFVNIADILQVQSRLDEAIYFYKKAILLNSNHFHTYHNLGNTLAKQGKHNDAIESYKNAITLNPNYFNSYFCIGLTFHEQSNFKSAILYYNKAISLKPDFDEALYMMALALKNSEFKSPNSDLYCNLLRMLEKETLIRPSYIANAALSLIKLEPKIKIILKKQENIKLDDNFISIISDLSKSTLLMKLMSVSKIPDLAFEKIFEKIRYSFLVDIHSIPNILEVLNFKISLVLQCLMNEYLYKESNEESNKLKALEKSIEKMLKSGKQPPLILVLCFASYRYLNNYKWSSLINFPKEFKNIEKLLIHDRIKEQELTSEIPILYKIDNEVSRKVKKQYEENPYPRWTSTPLNLQPFTISQMVKKSDLRLMNNNIISVSNPDIFVAGCGTGQHSISTASRFKNSNVLAIDLSMKSLAYAKRKTQELKIDNIEYIQADILNFAKSDKQFDIVESCGVLHHMDDPMAGWRVLVDLLKDGGLMLIGLYSKIARENITQIRNEIKSYDISSDDLGMRLFREKIINSEQSHHKMILKSQDFYSLSDFRDLLFHEQEVHFTLPEIKKCLSLLNLKFCGFESFNQMGLFKAENLEVDDICNLDKWSDFEEKNRSSFAGMYQFWCQKIK